MLGYGSNVHFIWQIFLISPPQGKKPFNNSIFPLNLPEKPALTYCLCSSRYWFMIVSCFPPAFPQFLSSKAVRTDSSHPPQEGLSLFQVQSELTGTVPTDPPAHSAKQTMTSPSTSLNHKFLLDFCHLSLLPSNNDSKKS